MRVPPGVPPLNVEIGGGMGSDYNHRVHMDSPSDMTALHAVTIGGGVQSMGYYMYHDGTNPAPAEAGASQSSGGHGRP